MVVGRVRRWGRLPRPVSLSTFADHFSSIARRYAQYRPHYPQALADALAERCTRRDAAWDAGAGNGQLSVQLAKHFTKVYAQDPSQAQLDAALLRHLDGALVRAVRHRRSDLGKRLAAIGGFLAGLAGAWLVLFARVAIECANFDAAPGQDCAAPGVTQWIAAAIGLLAIAAVISILAFRGAAPRR